MAQKWYQKASVQVAIVSSIGAIIIAGITILHQRSDLRSDNKNLSRDLNETKETLRKSEADNKILSRDLKKTEENLRKAQANNRTLSGDLKETEKALSKAEAERRAAETRLAPFLATANQYFQDLPEDKRLDTLLEKLDSMLVTVQHGDQNILLKLKNIESAVDSLSQSQPQSGDRSLSPPVVQRLTTSLKEFSGWEVEIVCLMGDGEAHSLAEQIKTVFTKANWKVNGVNQALFSKLVRRLILEFGIAPPEALQRAIVPLFDTLGYKREAFINKTVPEKRIKIIVGTK